LNFFYDQTGRSWPGGARMKHLFLQDYQDFFGLVALYPVHPIDPVRKWKILP